MVLARWLVYRRIFKNYPEKSKKIWKDYFSDVDFSKIILPTFIFSVLFTLMVNIDIVLVKSITTSEMTGYYGALSLLGKIIFWINSSIIAVTLPKAYAAGNEGKRLSPKIVLRTYISIIFIGILGILASIYWSKFLISYVFGLQYLVIANMLWLFSVTAFSLSLFSFEANLSYARHDFRISYILAAVVLAMMSSIHFFHNTIQEIVLSINIIFFLGYIAVLVMNLWPYYIDRDKLDNLQANTTI